MVGGWFYNLIGFVGACLILLGFYRTSIGRWKNKSFWYELDNLVGALLVIIYQVHLQAYISVALNIIWAIIAFKGLTSFAERYNWRHKTTKKRR
jgi:hypothetical protein